MEYTPMKMHAREVHPNALHAYKSAGVACRTEVNLLKDATSSFSVLDNIAFFQRVSTSVLGNTRTLQRTTRKTQLSHPTSIAKSREQNSPGSRLMTMATPFLSL